MEDGAQQGGGGGDAPAGDGGAAADAEGEGVVGKGDEEIFGGPVVADAEDLVAGAEQFASE